MQTIMRQKKKFQLGLMEHSIKEPVVHGLNVKMGGSPPFNINNKLNEVK